MFDIRVIIQRFLKINEIIIIIFMNFDNNKINNFCGNRYYEYGAFISLNSSELVNYNDIGHKTNGTFSTKKATAVFSADIAILSIEYNREYYKEESFQDRVD